MKTKKEQLKQKIVATLIVFFMFCMIFGSLDVINIQAATTTLAQNVVAGSMTVAASASVAFPNINLGIATNSLVNLVQVNITDFRGSGAGWSVTGTVNNLTATNSGTNTIANSFITWFPANGTWTALTGVTTGILNGAAANFGSATQLNLAGAPASSGMGNYTLTNILMNITYGGSTSQAAGTYQNTLTISIT